MFLRVLRCARRRLHLEQPETYGVALSPRHGSFSQSSLPYVVYKGVCQPRFERSKPVGPPVAAGSAVGEQLRLLLYAVFHVSALAVKPLVKIQAVVLFVGRYAARIGSPGPCSGLPAARRCFFQPPAPYSMMISLQRLSVLFRPRVSPGPVECSSPLRESGRGTGLFSEWGGGGERRLS